jgi:hypothetical protein
MCRLLPYLFSEVVTMLDLSLWPLWRALKAPLRIRLGKHYGSISRALKGLLSTTINDLVKTLQEEFYGTNTWEHLAKAKIRRKGNYADGFGDQAMTVKVFPLFAIEESIRLHASLRKRIARNVKLDAMRTEAGIDDAAWNAILDAYVTDFIRQALPLALRRMIKKCVPFYRFCHPIDLATMEPIRINGKAGHHTLVVLYDGPFSDDKPTVQKAARMWKERSSSQIDYTVSDYDGYTAA